MLVLGDARTWIRVISIKLRPGISFLSFIIDFVWSLRPFPPRQHFVRETTSFYSASLVSSSLVPPLQHFTFISVFSLLLFAFSQGFTFILQTLLVRITVIIYSKLSDYDDTEKAGKEKDGLIVEITEEL